MSLATWKKEFYPVTAKRCSKKNALAHSLQKWLGLRGKNLAKHGLHISKWWSAIIQEDERQSLPISLSTCALCHWATDRKTQDISYNYRCPLGGCRNAWTAWRNDNDPEPMIKLLRKCIRKAKK